MRDATLIFIAAVFALAGLVKGAIGLGLPTISMGLLAVAMPPMQAAALLTVPSLVANLWQRLAGRALAVVARRLWSMSFGSALVGGALALYAISGLAAVRLPAPRRWEPILSPVVGAITGLIAAATGVFVIPAVPYLQAIGFEKEQLVQALGLAFTVSTVALAVNVAIEGGLHLSLMSDTAAALAFAGVGMYIGQALRRRMSPAAFRQWLFAGLLLLGLYLASVGGPTAPPQ